MTYDKLIETVSEIVNNDLIYKDGLLLTYKMDSTSHRKLSEHFFYKVGNNDFDEFEYDDEFDVEIGDIIIKFVIG